MTTPPDNNDSPPTSAALPDDMPAANNILDMAARRGRRGSAAAGAPPPDSLFGYEIPEALSGMIERIRREGWRLAFEAAPLDIVAGFDREIQEAVRDLLSWKRANPDNSTGGKRCTDEVGRLRWMRRQAFSALDDAGVRIGRLLFRLGLLERLGDGAATVDWLARGERLYFRLFFPDGESDDVTTDFMREIIACHEQVFWNEGFVAISREPQPVGSFNEDYDLPRAERLDKHALGVHLLRHLKPHDPNKPVKLSDAVKAATASIRASAPTRGRAGEARPVEAADNDPPAPRPLRGFRAAPIMAADGSFGRTVHGYDPVTGIFLENPLPVILPDRSTVDDLKRWTRELREFLGTFSHADGVFFTDEHGVERIDLNQPMKHDESGAMAALLSIAARPSVDLEPLFALVAALLSGAGSGKGLLIDVLCLIVHGSTPFKIAPGKNPEETDKRIDAALLLTDPVVCLDDFNNMTLDSATMRSAKTTRRGRARPLGTSKTTKLAQNTNFINGNGLVIAGDTARRSVLMTHDARCDDPEAREFEGDIAEEAGGSRRAEMLTAVFGILRWSAQHREDVVAMPKGRPMGSYKTWARWVRDAVVAMGGVDVALKQSEIKAEDPRRLRITSIYTAWWQFHGDDTITVADLAPPVRERLSPPGGPVLSGAGLGAALGALARSGGTRMAGFHLTRQGGGPSPTSTHIANRTYALKWTGQPVPPPPRNPEVQAALRLESATEGTDDDAPF